MESKPEQVRGAMKGYWDHWVKDAERSGNFLKVMVSEEDADKAKDIHESDLAELTSLLPDLQGMDVLELAAGVGRLSPELAKKAKHVISTDMMESFVRENERTHGPQHSNMSFQQLDATKMDFPPNSFDCVTYVWLMLYLNNNEVEKFVSDLMRILRPGGLVFFREAHFTSVGSRVQTDEGNPAIYRSITEYMEAFKGYRYTDENNDTYIFDLVFAVNSRTYISLKGIPTVIYYLWKKTKVGEQSPQTSNERELNKALYSEGSLQVYDKVIGDGFTTPGGLSAAKGLMSKMDLKKGNRILDVGCGLGGLTSYLIKEHSLDVTGLDISYVAGQAAVLNFKTQNFRRGQIQICDLLKASFAESEFDAIFALDTLKYMEGKEDLLKKFKCWLKPSGQVLISDYCSTKNLSSFTSSALQTSQPNKLVSVDAYVKIFRDAGFTDINIKDFSKHQIQYIKSDLEKLEVEQDISAELKETFTNLWKSQLSALQCGDMVFIVFIASFD